MFLFDPHEFSILWMPLDTLVIFALGALALGERPPRTARPHFAQADARIGAHLGARDLRRSRRIPYDRANRHVGIRVDARAAASRWCSIRRSTAPCSGPSFRGPSTRSSSPCEEAQIFPVSWGRSARSGPFLARAFPRLEGDVNELPDEPSAEPSVT